MQHRYEYDVRSRHQHQNLLMLLQVTVDYSSHQRTHFGQHLLLVLQQSEQHRDFGYPTVVEFRKSVYKEPEQQADPHHPNAKKQCNPSCIIYKASHLWIHYDLNPKPTKYAYPQHIHYIFLRVQAKQ